MNKGSIKNKDHNRGISLIELVIAITIMTVLTGILAPMFYKYVEKSQKAKDVYTADQIARAVNIAFIENPEALEAFQKWNGYGCTVSVTENGVKTSYKVYRVASSGTQDTNKVSNCFNGNTDVFKKENGKAGKSDGSTGFYAVINRELGLSTTEMNSEIIPKYTKAKEGPLPSGVKSYDEIDRWRIVKRENGMMEIWAAQPNPGGGYPIYRVWPEPDDEYR